jgi:hypothetical protein
MPRPEPHACPQRQGPAVVSTVNAATDPASMVLKIFIFHSFPGLGLLPMRKTV